MPITGKEDASQITTTRVSGGKSSKTRARSYWINQTLVNAYACAEVAEDASDGGDVSAFFANDDSRGTVTTTTGVDRSAAVGVNFSVVLAVEEDFNTFVSMIAYGEGSLSGIGRASRRADDGDTGEN